MNKRHLHHVYTTLRHIKVWHLIVLFIVFAVLTVFLLRQNNLGMIELRNTVKQADEEDGDVKGALLNVQHYVSSHMNTYLGEGIFLEHSYRRAYDKAVQQAVNTTNPNTRFYEQVELECRPVFQRTGSFPAYTECARGKLATIGAGLDALSAFAPPPVDLYRYNFTSPLWSFDGAGFALILTALAAFLLLLRLLGYAVLRLIIKSHNGHF